jgi:hypothetical protein
MTVTVMAHLVGTLERASPPISAKWGHRTDYPRISPYGPFPCGGLLIELSVMVLVRLTSTFFSTRAICNRIDIRDYVACI